MRHNYLTNAALSLKENDLNFLKSLLLKETNERILKRVNIILSLHKGDSILDVAKNCNTTKVLVYRLLHKFLELGLEGAIYDRSRSGRPNIFSENGKSYVRQIACQIPYNVEGGPDKNLWTLDDLALYISKSCKKRGLSELCNIKAEQIYSLLKKTELKLYVEDLNLKKTNKLKIVPILYKRLEFFLTIKQDLLNNKSSLVIAYDDKSNISMVKDNKSFYNTQGSYTPSISNSIFSSMSGINLLTGEVIVLNRFSHIKEDFYKFLLTLRDKYQEASQIKLILDKHKYHTSKETRDFILDNDLNIKLQFNFEPAFYLNLFDTFYSKLIRIKLNGLMALDYTDLEKKIDDFVEELNLCKVVKRWEDDLLSIKKLCS